MEEIKIYFLKRKRGDFISEIIHSYLAIRERKYPVLTHAILDTKGELYEYTGKGVVVGKSMTKETLSRIEFFVKSKGNIKKIKEKINNFAKIYKGIKLSHLLWKQRQPWCTDFILYILTEEFPKIPIRMTPYQLARFIVMISYAERY